MGRNKPCGSRTGTWFNSLTRIGNKPIFLKEWSEIGMSKVKHLQPGINNFLTLKDFDSKHDLRVHPLSFYGVLSAVKSLGEKDNRHS